MARTPKVKMPVTPEVFRALARRFREQHGLELMAVDPEGRCAAGGSPCHDCGSRADCAEVRRRAVSETLRWGEPCINLCPEGRALWAVPVMVNAEVIGGLVATGAELPGGERQEGRTMSPTAMHAACNGLLQLALQRNLTNGAHLAHQRQEAQRQRSRAEAIHTAKTLEFDSIRDLYIREEPELLAAIKRGDRAGARDLINRVLVGIYHTGGHRLGLLKSFILEIVIMMCRTAVEAGADPTRILGIDYESLVQLARAGDEEALCHRLTELLERIMDAIQENPKYPNTVLLSRALRFMEEHAVEDISRDRAAQVACLSPGHFSHLLHEKTGRTFTDLLGQFRIDRACQLLRRSGKSLIQVSFECGFRDQSYFTKVFRRYMGMTPRQYRRSAGGESGGRS